MKLLTVADILTTCGKHPERMKFVTPQIEDNASRLVERVNALLLLFGESRPLTSGFRDAASNKAAKGAPRSNHLRGLAVDIADADRKLEKFIADGYALAACGLWAEEPDEFTRVHVQCVPFKSWKQGQRRLFKP